MFMEQLLCARHCSSSGEAPGTEKVHVGGNILATHTHRRLKTVINSAAECSEENQASSSGEGAGCVPAALGGKVRAPEGGNKEAT
jgi:hypothetical protein